MKKLNMYKHDTKGYLITFCGLDGCGKSTMIHMLSELIQREVFLTKQPTDNVRQTAIFRTYMDEPNHSTYDYRSLALLAVSDRVQHCNKVIFPQLENGKAVISDRYFYSCLANLRARGYKNDKWIYQISESLIKPDLSIFLDVPVELAVSRVRSRKEEKDRYIDMELQYKLRKEYLNIAEKNNGIILSTKQEPEETFKAIKNHLIKLEDRKVKYEFKT